MRAGLIRLRITVEEPVSGQNGEPNVTFTPRAVVWGSVEPISGHEAVLLGAQLASAMDTRIAVRWGPAIAGLTAAWRLRMGTTIYNIVSVVNVDMRNRRIELLCKSGTNQG